MIEPTVEMLNAFRDAWMKSMQGDPNPDDPERVADRTGLAAVLALVERDYRTEPRPPRERPLPRSADEHHYDVSCDDRPFCRIPQHHEAGVLP